MSNIPPLYEGTPFRADGHIITFQPVGTISVGNAVTTASGTNFGVRATGSSLDFLLGVALTTGGLAGGAQASFGAQGPTPIAVILRGVVDVIVDGNVVVGDFLVPSGTTAGYVHSTGTSVYSVSAAVTRAVALTGTTGGSGSTIQAYLF